MIDFHFSCRKYGRELLVDAAEIPDLPGFISDDRPHRLHFYDVTFVASGRGTLRIDGANFPVAPGVLLFTSPGQIRSWVLHRPLRGFALFFEPGFFAEFLAAPAFPQTIPGFQRGTSQAYRLDRASFRALVRQVREVIREIADGKPRTDDLLHGTVYRLLLDLRRRLPIASDEGNPAAQSHPIVEKYLVTLDRAPRGDVTVKDYARELGVTAGYLNRLTRRHLGRSAQETSHDRLMLEAKRLLRFTNLSVQQIAARLAFADPGYFARFFRAHSHESPKEFRKQHHST